MVYFVCETCNETLKKAQVEKHGYSCRGGCWGVTCVDCNVTFEGEAYREHTSCLSEDQKYQGALYKAPKAKNAKKRGINEFWAEAIAEAANSAKQSAPPGLSDYLIRMGELGNVPRQEKKFKNFASNSLRVFKASDISQLWLHLDRLKDNIVKRETEAKGAEGEPGMAAAPTRGRGGGGKREGKSTTGGEKAAAGGEGNSILKIDDPNPNPNGKREKKKRKRNDEGVPEGAEKGTKKGPSGPSIRAVDTNGREDAGEEREGGEGDAKSVGTVKFMGKAATRILKKAPGKELSIKKLTGEVVAAAVAKANKAKGDNCVEKHAPDETELRCLFKQLLKAGLRKVAVRDKVACYCPKASDE